MFVFNALKNLLTTNPTPQLPGTQSQPTTPSALTPFMNQAMANYTQQARPVQNLGFGVQPQPSVAQVLFSPRPLQQVAPQVQQVAPQVQQVAPQVQQVAPQVQPDNQRKSIPRINYPERFGDWGARFKQLEK